MVESMYEKLENNIKKASNGRELWLKIVEKYSIENTDYVILFPALNTEYNYYGMLYLEQFLKFKNAVRAIVLTYDENVKKALPLFCDKAEIIDFSKENAELIMKFYSLYQFTDRLIIISLDEPEGRSGIELIGKKGITLEELIALGVYGLRHFEKKKVPLYTGNDEAIKLFLGKH